jgi:hypothetical protein
MAMRVEWIVVVLAALPAQLVATALMVAIAPVSAATLFLGPVWQVSKAGVVCSAQTQSSVKLQSYTLIPKSSFKAAVLNPKP